MSLTKEDKENILIALRMRKNYIQTGDVVISATTAEKMGKGALIRPLSTGQMKLIIRTEELIAKLLR